MWRNRFRMSGLVFFTFLAFWPCGQPILEGDEVILNRDTRTMKIVPSETEPAGTGETGVQPPAARPKIPGAAAFSPKKRTITRIEIVQVIPMARNNPFNPVEPINNSNGQIIAPQQQVVVQQAQGQAEQPQVQAEQPPVQAGPPPEDPNRLDGPNAVNYGEVVANFFEASVEFNPATGRFRLIPLSSDNSAVIVSVQQGQNQADFFTALAQGFMGPQGSVALNSQTTIVITRTATGDRFQVTFTAGPIGTGLFNVSVVKL